MSLKSNGDVKWGFMDGEHIDLCTLVTGILEICTVVVLAIGILWGILELKDTGNSQVEEIPFSGVEQLVGLEVGLKTCEDVTLNPSGIEQLVGLEVGINDAEVAKKEVLVPVVEYEPYFVGYVGTSVEKPHVSPLVDAEVVVEEYNPEPLVLDEYNRDLMCRLVMGEAGGEGFNGAVLVAQTIRDGEEEMLEYFRLVSVLINCMCRRFRCVENIDLEDA